MKQTQLEAIVPKFVEEFSCIGSDCPDHCCRGWTIHVNKKSYKQLKKHGDIEVRQLVSSNFKLLRETDYKYAQISMDKEGQCPALDVNNLCMLHTKCGHDNLPYVCQSYPRSPKWFGNWVEMSMSLSCAVVTEKVLYDPEALTNKVVQRTADELNHGAISGLKGDKLPSYLPAIRGFCIEIAVCEGLSLEEKLFAMFLFLKQADKRLSDLQSISRLIDNMAQMIQEGNLQKYFSKLPSLPDLRWHSFAILDNQLMSMIVKRNTGTAAIHREFGTFLQCQQQLMASIGQCSVEDGVFNTANIKVDGSQYNQTLLEAQQHLDNHFKENPQLLTNFLLYSLYDSQFMAESGESPWYYLKILILDVLLIKSYLSGIAIQQQGLNKKWVTQLFQGYFKRRQHMKSLPNAMKQVAAKVEEENEYALFYLLKT